MKERIIMLVSESGNTHIVNALRDYHTKEGMLSSADMMKAKLGSLIRTNTGAGFTVLLPDFADFYRKIRRGAQIITLKDIGHIVALTGIGKESVVVDAGTGSGALACFLAHIVKRVISYEIRDDFYGIAAENRDKLGLSNLEIVKRDIYTGIVEKNLDLITLDLPEPWNVVKHAAEALKLGGFLVSYSPTIPQVSDFVTALQNDRRWLIIKVCEIMEREWEVDGRRVRPTTQRLGHTGFMTFARRLR